MRYPNRLLDFDGTVARSHPGIEGAVACGAARIGKSADLSQHWKFIGPHPRDYAIRWLGATEEEGDRFFEGYQDYYNREGWKNCSYFEGMEDLLDDLRGAGCKIYLCTSKPLESILPMIERMELRLDGMGAALLDRGITAKRDVMGRLLQDCGLDPARCVMVGDHKGDILAAGQFGMDSIAALYGYCREEDMLPLRPTYAVRSVEELRGILL